MPKVRGSKSRVHLKAVGNTKADASPAAATAAPSASPTMPKELQDLKEQYGLEFDEDRDNKKDKRKMRHDKWMSKLEATYNPQKKKKKSAQNQTLSVDFGSFHDVLSTLDPTKAASASASVSASTGVVPAKSKQPLKGGAAVQAAVQAIDHQQFTIHSDSSKPLQSKKAKKKAAMQEILRFQNVLAHPAFKSNPLLTIQQHVKNTMEMAPPEPSATPAIESMED